MNEDRSGPVGNVSEEPVGCQRCGATTQLNNGWCVRCLLGEALSGDSQASSEAFERVLEEVNVPDREWRFGNYEIIEEIARGGMGVVYRARQRHSRRVVALKRVLSFHAGSHEMLARFRREAEASANLDHPNILPVFEVGESEEGLPYFSMKYVAGGSLQQAAASLHDQPRRVVELMAKVARAVEYAHQKGILHRDLKPGNILVDEQGEPWVSDFGLAKCLDAKSDLTRTITSLGTPGYIAPEQAQSTAADLTPAADVYSLGAILFGLLTGQPPFSGANALSVIRQAAENPAPKLRAVDPALDRDLETICERCLERDPKLRYQSAANLAEDLQRWLDGRPILSRPVSPPARAWRWTRRNPKLITAGAIGLVLGAAALWLFRENLASIPPEKSVAVVPFIDLSEAKDQEYFCDGISEEILSTLARVDGLRVVARASSFAFEGKNASPAEIGEKLNVENVLEGTVRRDGDHVRVTAELINTRTGYRLWTESYDRELQGMFALQDEIAQAIADALKIRFAVALPSRPPRNTEVHDLYLQGLYFSNKGSEADLRCALDFFQRAVELDPNFGRAWTGLAKTWYFLADVYVRPLEAYPKSREAALKAIALDEKEAEPHCYLSEAKRVLDWDLAGADAELKAALQLDPNSAPAHFFSGLVPLFRGDPKEGLRLVLEAKRLDPVSPITSYVTTAAYLANDQIDDALAEGKRTFQLDPNYYYLDSNLAAAYREKGNFAEAVQLYEKAQAATNIPSSGLAITYARMGKPEEARKILDQLLQLAGQHYVSAPTIAVVYVALGEKEEAFRWLERAYAEHSGILQWIAFLPEFRPLRSDARFPDLLKRAGISHEPTLRITETSLSEVADPNAEQHFSLKVGVAPQPKTENGHTVRISVAFYDLTSENKMRPTIAQVGYNWLTAPRDWTQPTPKFIAANYTRPKSSSPDGRRYGGYIVRVYFDGELQDRRANPADLLTLFPKDEQAPTAHGTAPPPP